MDIGELRKTFKARVKVAGGRKAVAESIGCTTAAIGMLESGPLTPSLKLAAKIEQHLGINASLWVARDDAKGGTE